MIRHPVLNPRRRAYALKRSGPCRAVLIFIGAAARCCSLVASSTRARSVDSCVRSARRRARDCGGTDGRCRHGAIFRQICYRGRRDALDRLVAGATTWVSSTLGRLTSSRSDGSLRQYWALAGDGPRVAPVVGTRGPVAVSPSKCRSRSRSRGLSYRPRGAPVPATKRRLR